MIPINYTAQVLVYPVAGRNLFGETIAITPVPTMVAVIKFSDISMPTPIRSGASATAGRADDDKADVVLLVPYGSALVVDQRIDVYDVPCKITGVWPRVDIFGQPEFTRVTLDRTSAGPTS